jgi:metal-responsive CopG/Arc/MetJ family transcriptional regulator
MITKTKKSVSLSNSLMKEMAQYSNDMNVSQFIESALIYYINELKKQERNKRDKRIINANSRRFNKQAEENLRFQVMR